MRPQLYRLPALVVLFSTSVLGAAPCAACHAAEAKFQPSSAMAHALEPIAACDILKRNKDLRFQQGRYRYHLTYDGGIATYEVTDGSETLKIPLVWAFGLGDAGQTYVFRRNGNLYESRVSFYKAIQGLDITLGANHIQPANLEEAAGRLMAPTEAGQCFGCHATHATRGNQVDLTAMRPGVQCERCHAGAERHAAALNSGSSAKMPKLSALSTEEMSNFCGQCHRTWSQIASGGPHGVANVRFQPYRLTNSKCYDVEDARIRCTACHDPHQPLETAAARCDEKCQACHAAAHAKVASKGKSCPVATSGCAGCHMPKIEIPGSHNLFTDHQIRVVRKNTPYPD